MLDIEGGIAFVLFGVFLVLLLVFLLGPRSVPAPSAYAACNGCLSRPRKAVEDCSAKLFLVTARCDGGRKSPRPAIFPLTEPLFVYVVSGFRL